MEGGGVSRGGRDACPNPTNPRSPGRMPGVFGEAETAFDVSQVPSWLAKERRGIQEQIEGMEEIPRLMGDLLA